MLINILIICCIVLKYITLSLIFGWTSYFLFTICLTAGIIAIPIILTIWVCYKIYDIITWGF